MYFPHLDIPVMDNKMFRVLKSNNCTHTRVSQKIGGKGNAWFYAFSLYLSFSFSFPLFLSSLGHDIDRTTDSKRITKGKRGKIAQLRPEYIDRGKEEEECN